MEFVSEKFFRRKSVWMFCFHDSFKTDYNGWPSLCCLQKSKVNVGENTDGPVPAPDPSAPSSSIVFESSQLQVCQVYVGIETNKL
jgi:hypothetical protein